ncbi:MAG: 2-dehydro-3-deoxygalactonokinase [Clostridia bacterium]
MLWIDGGTTNTRFTLTRGEAVLERFERHMGAANADASLQNEGLRALVARELSRLQTVYHGEIERLCISGMITSANGLIEVAHLTAPVGLAELKRGVRTVLLPEIAGNLPIDCIPGVRCGEADTVDMMRGEETEVMGVLQGLGDALILHFGSHSKAILVKDGRIVRSLTTLSGELLHAVTTATILRSSVTPEPPELLAEEELRRGAAAARAHGLSRALFQARLDAVLCGKTGSQIWSYLFGALAQADVTAFEPLLCVPVVETVAYGRTQFVQAFGHCVAGRAMRCISYEDSEWLSLRGMRAILGARG